MLKPGHYFHHLMWTEAKWAASKHSAWPGGLIVWLYLWNPSMFCFFAPFLHNMFFFLSHSIQEPPRSSLYVLVVVMATGQHPCLSIVQCLPFVWASQAEGCWDSAGKIQSPYNWVLEGRKWKPFLLRLTVIRSFFTACSKVPPHMRRWQQSSGTWEGENIQSLMQIQNWYFSLNDIT